MMLEAKGYQLIIEYCNWRYPVIDLDIYPYPKIQNYMGQSLST